MQQYFHKIDHYAVDTSIIIIMILKSSPGCAAFFYMNLTVVNVWEMVLSFCYTVSLHSTRSLILLIFTVHLNGSYVTFLKIYAILDVSEVKHFLP